MNDLSPTSENGESQLKRKSVTWKVDASEPGESVSKQDDTNVVVNISPEARPWTPTRAIPKLRRSRKSILSRKLDKSSLSWIGFKLACACCVSSVDVDSDDEYADFRLSKMKLMEEDEIISRLQQAVHELCQRPTNYDIDAETQKWHRTLENEQRQYEESGRPKFKYIWFRQNQHLIIKKLPLYGTNYEDHRKLEIRLDEFRFGASRTRDDSYTCEGKFRSWNSYDSKDSTYWRKEDQVLYANLALLCSVNNFLRFPQACYVNGGFAFLLTYCLMIACVGQPLLYFEMVLGQYSFHGPSGFARLHPYAKGIPYAISFVCIYFGTSRSVYLAYNLMYSVISLIASPGMCGKWGFNTTKCVPYNNFEDFKDVIKAERAKINSTSHHQNVSIFSVELYFREVMLDADWKTGTQSSFFHWKLIIAYFIVCCMALVPIHYNLAGRNMKRYLCYSVLLPAMLIIVFLHQIIGRGAFFLTVSYFLTVDPEHVSAISVWSEAFEMVLSTLGIGYGFHWFVAGNVSMDYKETYRLSWRLCGYAAFCGLISSLVLFCEIGIVGDITEDDSHYHVFFERLGISFVCYSGALLKLGANTVVFVVIFFAVSVLYGMWSQVIIADIILRWIEQGHIITGPKQSIKKRRKSTLLLLIGIQLITVSPYCLTNAASVFASENIFGGSLAAYLVVLMELVIVVYLYGFNRFLADVEILTKRPLPALFQIQIRYVVIPTIMIFMLPMIVNVYLYPSIYVERNKLGSLFYLGLVANFVPVVIMGFAVKFDFSIRSKANKVNPVNFIYYKPKEMMEEIRKRYPQTEPMFVAKVGAPSQQSHRIVRSEIYHAVEYNMDYVHKCQNFVKSQFMKLLVFKLNQTRWLKITLAVLNRKKIISMRRLVQRIMLARKYRNDRVDINFLNEALQQIVNLTFGSAIRKLQRMPMQEMLLYLTDELLKITTFHFDNSPYNVYTWSSSSESSDDDDDDDDDNNNSSSDDGDEVPRAQYLQTHRKLIGQLEKSSEESRTLLMIRLKRGLHLPHIEELSVLKFLRRERAKQARELSCWTQNDLLPIDHFIPASISNSKKEKVCFTIFHAVVIEGSDHYALKRLPVPRPAIVKVTKNYVQAQPGDTLTDKFSNIATKKMYQNISRVLAKRNLQNLSRKKLQRHLWRVSDRVDDDVYDFLDRILTCIIVVVSDEEVAKKPKRKVYLTPRTRRATLERAQTHRRRAVTADLDLNSYPALDYKQRQVDYWGKLLEQRPADIRYHSDSSGSDSDKFSMDEEEDILDVQSSSGSTSTLSSDDVDSDALSHHASLTTVSATSISTQTSHRERLKSNYFLMNETLQHRDKRLSMKHGITSEHAQVGKDADVSVSIDKIRHISARKWKHERDMVQTKSGIGYTAKELQLHDIVDAQAKQRALESKSMDTLRNTRKDRKGLVRRALSLQSLRLNETDSLIVRKDLPKSGGIEGKLKNTNPDLRYLTYGKSLVVDHISQLTSTPSQRRRRKTRTKLHAGVSSH